MATQKKSNYYTKLVIVILLVIGLAQAAPELINTFLILVLLSMLVMQAGQFAKLIKMLNLN